MSHEKKKALGKGLESLLPRRPAVPGIGGGATAPAKGAAEEAAATAQADAPGAPAGGAHGGNGAMAEATTGGGHGGNGATAAGTTGGAKGGANGGNGAGALAASEKAAMERAVSAAYPYAGPEVEDNFAPGVRPEVYAAAMQRIQEHYAPEMVAEFKTHKGEVVVEIPLRLIERNPYQTRVTGLDDPNLEELTASIAAQGVLEPILVRPMKQPGAMGQMYQLIAGERRWLASRNARKLTIPAIVRDVSSEQVMVMTIIENLLRQDLNAMQHARGFRRLGDEFRLTQEEIARKTGMARSAIANYLRLTRLPEAVQKSIQEGRLSFGHAKILLQVPLDEDVAMLAKKVVAGNLTVRETELLVEEFVRPHARPAAAERQVDPNVRAAEVHLEQSLGCRVQIKDQNGKGKIVIEYRSLEDFDRVVEALK